MIQFCAGINDLTTRIRHKDGQEIIPKTNQHLWPSISSFAVKVKEVHARSIVCIATIPILDFAAAQSHYIKVGKLRRSRYSSEQTKAHQSDLSHTVKTINEKIHEFNVREQEIIGLGKIKPLDLYWHQYVEKQCGKKQSSQLGKRRIVRSALIDGIHPTPRVQEKWFEITHANLLKLCTKIKVLKQSRL
jgi:hypothetical protein